MCCMTDRRRRATTWVAFGLFGLVLAEVGTGVAVAVVAGLTFAQARDAFVVTNSVIAVSCAVAGLLLGWQRPRNPVGWLLLAAGVLQAGTVATAPFVAAWPPPGLSDPVARTVATVSSYSWPWSIALCLPLALLLFPDGTLPGRRWRFLLTVVVAEGALFTIEAGAEPVPGQTAAWLVLPNYADLAPLWTVSEIVNGVVYLATFAGLVVRYRRADEQRRRQLLWLLLALLAMLVMLAIWAPAVGAGELVFVLLVIPLVPAAITIAVLRHQLLDIRLVFSRAVLYALLSAGVVGAYLGLVALADVVQRGLGGAGGSIVATLVIALGFNPVRVRLQRVVDRTLYGDRSDPVRAVSRLGERLSGGPGTGPADALDLVREALRLPYAALRTTGASEVTSGVAGERCESVALVYGGEEVGELVVGVRSGQRALDGADRAVLEILAVPLAMAVRATALSDSLQRSRGEIVTAREEERRRLRRDLHDGLGPVLTGVAFQADAAGNLIRSDPDRAAALLAGLRKRTAEAIDDVRRLVHELRPPALDELGLVGALRRHVEEFAGPPHVTVEALVRCRRCPPRWRSPRTGSRWRASPTPSGTRGPAGSRCALRSTRIPTRRWSCS